MPDEIPRMVCRDQTMRVTSSCSHTFEETQIVAGLPSSNLSYTKVPAIERIIASDELCELACKIHSLNLPFWWSSCPKQWWRASWCSSWRSSWACSPHQGPHTGRTTWRLLRAAEHRVSDMIKTVCASNLRNVHHRSGNVQYFNAVEPTLCWDVVVLSKDWPDRSMGATEESRQSIYQRRCVCYAIISVFFAKSTLLLYTSLETKAQKKWK